MEMKNRVPDSNKIRPSKVSMGTDLWFTRSVKMLYQHGFRLGGHTTITIMFFSDYVLAYSVFKTFNKV